MSGIALAGPGAVALLMACFGPHAKDPARRAGGLRP
jgi:hypothetical protein